MKTPLRLLALILGSAFSLPCSRAAFPLPTPPAGVANFALEATNSTGSVTLSRLAPNTEWLLHVTGTVGDRTFILGTSGAQQGDIFTARCQFPNSFAQHVLFLNGTYGGLLVDTIAATGDGTDIQRSFLYDGTKWIIYTPNGGTGGGGGGTPGGTNGQIQYNNVGSFGGFTASGDATINTSTGVVTFANSGVTAAQYGSATAVAQVTFDAKGRVTLAGNVTITPAVVSITGLGTGVGTALAVNVGSAGAPVLFNGAGGTPSSMTGTNITGTAAGLTAGTASAVAVGGITGLGSNIATFLATPSGANLASALTTALPTSKGGLGADFSGATGFLYDTAGTIAAKTAAQAAHLMLPSAVALTESAGTTTIDCSLSNSFTLTLNAHLTSVTISNFVDGQTIIVTITNTVGNYSVTWGNSILWPGGSQLVQTVGAHSDVWTLVKQGSAIYGAVVQNY